MAGNHNAFRGNQFSSYIIPLVDHFNAPGTRFNPFEAWAAANVLTAFTQRWQGPSNNLNGTYAERTGDGDTKLVDTFASKIEYAANRERTVARTNLVQQLEKKLKSAFVGGSNAWVDWLHATEYYFNNVDFVGYFTHNYNAEYRQLVFDSLAMFKHPELTLDGYEFIIKTQGEFPTKAVTTIDVGTLITGLDLPFPAPYIATYRDATTLDVFWMNENNYVQPVVAGGLGVTSVYHNVDGLSNNQTDNALIWENTINAVGVGYDVTNLGTQLTVKPPVAGSLPATLYSFDSYALAAWNVGYVNGTGVESSPATTKIVALGTTVVESVDPGPYHAVYLDSSNRAIFWYRVGTSFIQPVVPVDPGYSDTYYQIDLPEFSTGPAAALVIKNAMEGFAIPQLAAPAIINSNEVVISLAVDGPAAAPSISGNFFIGGFEFGWDMIFTDGVTGSATNEAFYIDFRNAKPAEIAGKYSVINNQVTGDNHIIWWNTGGIPQPTVSVTNPVYTELVIDSATDGAGISKQLELAIDGGAPALSFMNVITPGEILELEFVADVTFETDTLMPGTAATGIDFAFSDKLYASDNTELASGINTLAEYATLYNSLLVPYESNTFNIRYPYIIGFGGGGVAEADGTTACGFCSNTQGWIPREDDDIIQGCKKCYKFFGGGGAGGSVFRSGPYGGSSYTSPIRYNTPGTIFDVVEGGKDVLSVKDID